MNIYKTMTDRETVDGITSRDVVIGNPGYGKSTYGRLKIENYCKNGWPLTAIDIVGIAASVRTVRDDIVILGGEYSDVNVEKIDRVIPILLDNNVNFILDISEYEEEEAKELVGDIFEYLFKWHKQNKKVRHYLVDECDYYIPEYHFDKVCKANITKCVSKGQMYGMGFTFITQNFTMIDKKILKMVNNHILFNLSDPIDLRRVGNLLGERVDANIKHLGVGECLVYNKQDRNTYTVDEPESPSWNATPKFGEEFVRDDILELNDELKELIDV